MNTQSNTIKNTNPASFGKWALGVIKTRNASLLLLVLVISTTLTILQPRFLSQGNLSSVLIGMAYTLPIALGMTLVMILGGIDLSVGPVLALTAITTTLLLSRNVGINLPIPLAILAGLSAAVFCGALNGLGVAWLKLAPFIVTLSMLTIVQGIVTVTTSGWFISGLPEAYTTIGQGFLFDILPIPVFITFIIFVVFYFLLTRWKPLNQAYYVGNNPAAAALSGQRVMLVTFFGYVISSLMAGVAAIFMTSRLAMGFFQFGQGAELNAIASAVIGGASFAGGKGNLMGTFLGVLLLAIIQNGFSLLGGQPNWLQIVNGAILFIAIAFDGYRRRKETRE
jgi:ribose transport system permease protein